MVYVYQYEERLSVNGWCTSISLGSVMECLNEERLSVNGWCTSISMKKDLV